MAITNYFFSFELSYRESIEINAKETIETDSIEN